MQGAMPGESRAPGVGLAQVLFGGVTPLSPVATGGPFPQAIALAFPPFTPSSANPTGSLCDAPGGGGLGWRWGDPHLKLLEGRAKWEDVVGPSLPTSIDDMAPHPEVPYVALF